MKTYFVAALLFFANFSKAQNWNKNIKLSVEVKNIDSTYIMVPQLKIFSDSQNILINKRFIYANETDPTADLNFYIQKQIGGAYVNLYMTALGQPVFSNDYFELTKFTSKDKLKDSLDLKNYLPFEVGDYRIQITLKYNLNGIKYTVESNYFEFTVAYKPKNSIFR